MLWYAFMAFRSVSCSSQLRLPPGQTIIRRNPKSAVPQTGIGAPRMSLWFSFLRGLSPRRVVLKSAGGVKHSTRV